MQQQPSELQQVQAELNDTALTLVREQRKLKQSQNNLQSLLQAVLNLAKTDDVEIKSLDDALNYLNSKAIPDETEEESV